MDAAFSACYGNVQKVWRLGSERSNGITLLRVSTQQQNDSIRFAALECMDGTTYPFCVFNAVAFEKINHLF